MFKVALIGLDGVGKTTVSRRVEKDFPFPLQYMYMGANIEACNYALPTTRWWWRRQGRSGDRPDPTRKAPPAGGGPLARSRRALRKSLGFANRVADEIYRELVIAWFQRRGCVILQDRHFGLDYHHGDRAGDLGWKRRLHARLRGWIHRPPDLVILLDAPAQVAFERKGEFDVDFLERRRAEYLSLADHVPHFAIVDADRRLEDVVLDVRRKILDHREAKLDAAA